MAIKTLKDNWRLFAEKSAAGMNATDAYLESGYKSTTRKNAQRAAWRLGERPEVAAYIAELRAVAVAKGKAEVTMALEDKLEVLVRIIKTGAGAIQGDHELCQHFRQFSDGSISIRLPCKIQAIKLHTELSGDLDEAKASRMRAVSEDDIVAKIVNEIRNREALSGSVLEED